MESWPEIGHGLQFYRQAFHDLHTARPQGMGGGGPIPWTAINEWALRHGVDGDDFDDLVMMVRAQDGTWLEYQADQKPAKKTQGNSDRVEF